ncbi:MAG: hypothetical protein EKK61_02330 [Rickettsiales bacterium]|nr:MAG: hypothetical protein EKK61_02330 [Rickettsiales bacterium]
MKKINKSLAIALISSCIGANAYAETGTVAIGPRLSTQGIGAEIVVPITDTIFGRINGNYFTYKHSLKNGEIDLKGKLTLQSVPIMIDWHPIDNSGFRISVGVAYNDNELKAVGSTNKGVTINNHYYAPNQIGTVSAKLTLGNALAAIASIGYEGAFIDNGPFSFNCELGAMYTGKLKLTVNSTGIGGNFIKEDVRKDVKKSLDKSEKYLKIFPIISLGFKYAI